MDFFVLLIMTQYSSKLKLHLDILYCNITFVFLILGDLFEKLEDEDEQGWCKGRKDGKVGLYPANYIEVI